MARYLGLAWLPLVAAVVWFGTILALMIIWLAEGHPRYVDNEPSLVYISDVGGHVKPLFIAGASVTAVFFILSLLADHFLRYNTEHQRLPEFLRKREAICSILAIIFGSLGSISLVLLTIMDVFHHHTAHWVFTAGFVVLVAINTVFNGIEVAYLSRDYPGYGRLRTSAILKAVLISFGVAFAIAFAALISTCKYSSSSLLPENKHCDHVHSAAAGFEWGVAFIFAFYLGTYIIDLRHPYYNLMANHPRNTRNVGQVPAVNAVPMGEKIVAAPAPTGNAGL